MDELRDLLGSQFIQNVIHKAKLQPRLLKLQKWYPDKAITYTSTKKKRIKEARPHRHNKLIHTYTNGELYWMQKDKIKK